MLEYILEKQELLCPLCPWRRSSGSCAGGTTEQLSLGRREGVPARLVVPLGELDLETKVLLFSLGVFYKF